MKQRPIGRRRSFYFGKALVLQLRFSEDKFQLQSDNGGMCLPRTNQIWGGTDVVWHMNLIPNIVVSTDFLSP